MIVRWRNQFGMTPMEHPLLISARVVNTPALGRPKPTLLLVLQNLLPAPPGVLAVELADGRRVFAPAGSDRSVFCRSICVCAFVTPSLPRLLGCLLDQDFIPREATVRRCELYQKLGDVVVGLRETI